MSPNEQDLTFEWSRRIGGDPKHGHNELQLLRQIARARGHATTHTMNEVAALRAIAASYGKSNVGYMNELDALRAIVDGMGATPSNRNLRDMNEIDCLWAIIRAGGGASAYDADAADYFARVVANAGTISDATKTAVNARVIAAKLHGIWPKWTRKNLFCGNQLAAALVPLKAVGGNATDTNTNFVEGDYSEATGLTAGTGNEFLNTGLLANALTANSTHLAVYNRGSSNVGGSIHIGAQLNAANACNLYAPLNTGAVFSDQYDGTGGRITAAIGGTPFGLVTASRLSATDHKIYRNAGQLATNGTSGGTLPAFAFYVFAANLAGTAGGNTSHNLASYSIGDGLTGAEEALDYTDEQEFQTLMGRNV